MSIKESDYLWIVIQRKNKTHKSKLTTLKSPIHSKTQNLHPTNTQTKVPIQNYKHYDKTIIQLQKQNKILRKQNQILREYFYSRNKHTDSGVETQSTYNLNGDSQLFTQNQQDQTFLQPQHSNLSQNLKKDERGETTTVHSHESGIHRMYSFGLNGK